VYTVEKAIIENTIEHIRDVRINAQIFSTYTHNSITSHRDTINHWIIEILRKNNHLPKNFSISLHLANFSSLTLVVNKAIISNPQTHIASTVKKGDIADQ
jgi:hypothetical protein